MFTGILFILGACFCWGLTYVVPGFMGSFNAFDIALGRFIIFGVVSLLMLVLTRPHLISRVYAAQWKKALILSFVSTFLTYVALVFCIQYANAALSTLLMGMCPLTIPLIGNMKRKERPFRVFLVPGLLMVMGILFTNLHAFSLEGVPYWLYLLGVLGGIVGLSAWTAYTVMNFSFMEKNKHLSPNDCVVMIGVATLAFVVVAIVGYLCFMPDLSRFSFANEGMNSFIVGSFILGFVSSWLGFYLWNYGSLRLPNSLSGQLYVFTTVFGLMMVFAVEMRWPEILELAGILFMLGGVWAALKHLKEHKSEKPETADPT